jgi:hypothetical protein
VSSGLSVRLRVAAAVLTAAVLAGALAACDGGSPSASTPASTSASALPTPSRSHTPPPAVPNSTPSLAVTTLKPVPIGSPAALTSNVRVAVRGIRRLTVTAAGPGETAGPAVTFVVEVRNGSSGPVDLDGVAVTAGYGAAQTPAVPSSAAPSAPLTGRLAPGATGRGTYVFRLPAASGAKVRIQVSAAFAAAVAVFRS